MVSLLHVVQVRIIICQRAKNLKHQILRRADAAHLLCERDEQHALRLQIVRRAYQFLEVESEGGLSRKTTSKSPWLINSQSRGNSGLSAQVTSLEQVSVKILYGQQQSRHPTAGCGSGRGLRRGHSQSACRQFAKASFRARISDRGFRVGLLICVKRLFGLFLVLYRQCAKNNPFCYAEIS